MQFQLRESRTIENLGLEVQHFAADGGKVNHYHLHSDSPENTFAITVRTAPSDSTGVAHILEHTVLCGSRNYPVRDPFFVMLRRSLSSFMNAMTAPDWTTYLFATADKTDFTNLAGVYLDAVFRPNLNPLDFAQEGHRLEIDEDEDGTPRLVRKGVVYNEMKGAMSSVTSQLYQQLGEHLFPTTTYGVNSGGDPKHIPQLTYQDFKHFYDTHYHPHNCTFFSSGNLSPQVIQRLIADTCNQDLPNIADIDIPPEPAFSEPLYKACRIAAPAESGTHAIIGWVFPDDTSIQAQLDAALVSELLMSSRAAPLRKALLDSGMGSNIGPMSGLDSHGRQAKFFAGLEKCTASAEEFTELVLQTLRSVAEKGIAESDIAAALHQFELSVRSLGGDSLPVGLELSLAMADSAVHRQNPIAAIDLAKPLEDLRKRATPQYISKLLRQLLIDNPHRITLIAAPDQNLHAAQALETTRELEELRGTLKPQAIAELRDQADKLQERQAQSDDVSLLPLIEVADIDRKPRVRYSATSNKDGIAGFAAATNGLAHIEVALSTATCSIEAIKPLQTLCGLLPSLGYGDMSAEEAQQYARSISGGVSFAVGLGGSCPQSEAASVQLQQQLTLSCEGLESNIDAMTDLLHDKWQAFHFDQFEIIRELLATTASRTRMSVPGSGHELAMRAALAGVSANVARREATSGLTRIDQLQRLAEMPQQDLLAMLAEAGELLRSCKPVRAAVVATPASLDTCMQSLSKHFATAFSATAQNERQQMQEVDIAGNVAWLDNMDASYCAQAYPGFAWGDERSIALQLAGPILRNGYLHNNIREIGGAYGAGATYNRLDSGFAMFSYRDPSPLQTFAHFDKVMQKYSETAPSQQELDDAKRNVISAMQRSQSLPEQVLGDWNAQVRGYASHDAATRERILDTTAEQVRTALATIAQAAPCRALIAPPNSADVAEELGLTVKHLGGFTP